MIEGTLVLIIFIAMVLGMMVEQIIVSLALLWEMHQTVRSEDDCFGMGIHKCTKGKAKECLAGYMRSGDFLCGGCNSYGLGWESVKVDDDEHDE